MRSEPLTEQPRHVVQFRLSQMFLWTMLAAILSAAVRLLEIDILAAICIGLLIIAWLNDHRLSNQSRLAIVFSIFGFLWFYYLPVIH